MSVVGFFIQQNCGARHSLSFVIEIGNHVQQLLVTFFGCPAVAKESFIDFFTVNGKWTVLRTVRSQTPTVLVDILII